MGASRATFPALNIKFNDGASRDTTKLSKRAVSALATAAEKNVEKFEGTARVTYTRNMYNEFEFTSKKDFMTKVEPCIEKELIDEFGN